MVMGLFGPLEFTPSLSRSYFTWIRSIYSRIQNASVRWTSMKFLRVYGCNISSLSWLWSTSLRPRDAADCWADKFINWGERDGAKLTKKCIPRRMYGFWFSLPYEVRLFSSFDQRVLNAENLGHPGCCSFTFFHLVFSSFPATAAYLSHTLTVSVSLSEVRGGESE